MSIATHSARPVKLPFIPFEDVCDLIEHMGDTCVRITAPNGLDIVNGVLRIEGDEHRVVLAVSPITGDARVVNWAHSAN